MINETIYSPIKGVVKKLSEVNDPIFSGGKLGKGIGIVPAEGVVFAPVNCTVTSLFPTKHAITLLTRHGAKIMIHVGINTVELKGSPFAAFVKEGDAVEKGQILLEFDMDAIKNAGYDLDTTIIVLNTAEYTQITHQGKACVNVLDDLILLEK